MTENLPIGGTTGHSHDLSELTDADGLATPLCRARILATVLQRIAISQQPLNEFEIIEACLKEMGFTEEQGAHDVLESIFWLCAHGIVAGDHFDCRRQHLIGGGRFRPSRPITRFVWQELDQNEAESTE